MRSCDMRLELRLPAREKTTLMRAAEAQGVTVSALIRRAVRGHLSMPEPVSQEDAITIAGLRRRINQIEARIGGGHYAGLASDLGQVRQDAQALLGR